MDLLEYGMKNRKSSSPFIRALARAALRVEIVRADLLEKKLNSRGCEIPDGDGDLLWKRIQAQIKTKDRQER